MNNARALAASFLDPILAAKKPLHPASFVFPKTLSPGDKSFVLALCFGVCRFAPRLQAISALLLEKPFKAKDGDINALLLVGLFQLTEQQTPDHAAVHATVEAAKALKKPWACGVINAVLQKVGTTDIEHKLRKDTAWKTAHPNWLVGLIQKAWPEQAAAILEAGNSTAPMHLRINRQKTSRDAYHKLLTDNGIESQLSQQCSDGLTLKKAQQVTDLPHFEEGFLSVQDLAAQCCADWLPLEEGQIVWDICAAPGGKAAHLKERSPAAQITAIDIEAARCQKTTETFERLQLEIPVITADAVAWMTDSDEHADVILIDAPCSGTGVIRRHPDIKILRRYEDISALGELQMQLLEAAWPRLAPGGRLLYATCSILPQENAEQIKAFLKRHPDAAVQSLAASDFAQDTGFGWQVMPGTAAMDGFFYSLLVKS